VCIRGASGAGKTTLLHVIGGLEQPNSGTVEIGGADVYMMRERKRSHVRGTRIGFVFQAYHLLPELTVEENVLLPSMRLSGVGRARVDAEKRALELLDLVGLSERLEHRPAELSGGEQQRAAIARSLINDPDIILADEPTGNLDSRTGESVLDLLFDLVGARRRTLVMVTHNDQVAERCSRSMILEDGTIR
jgi:ABC-type lipoprotein export system ATPase subunit